MITFGYEGFFKYGLFIGPLFLVDLSLLFILSDILDFNIIIASVIPFLLTGFLGYFLERKYIFKSNNRSYSKGFLFYLLIISIGAVLVAIGVKLLIDLLHVDILWARVIVALFSGVWDYTMNYFFNFKK